MVGNSENGGAGYVNNDHRENRWNNRGFRLSVVSVKLSLNAQRFFPATNHLADFNKHSRPREIIGFFNQLLFHSQP